MNLAHDTKCIVNDDEKDDKDKVKLSLNFKNNDKDIIKFKENFN
jgi:hypothetical protein